jgi:hypothetical protein
MKQIDWVHGGGAIALLILALFGDAIIDWIDAGRIAERIEHNQREAVRAFGTGRE